MTPARPLASLLLLAYRQQATIEAAVRGALAQTYSPLEIVISDDASDDATWATIERTLAGYAGPHQVVLNRNPVNLGIGAHVDRLVELSRGELLFIAAGDDISLPERCSRVVAAWIAADRRPDLIATALIDMDDRGDTHATVTPTNLGSYRDAADWLERPPHVIGAAQAWTRRVFEFFGPLPAGTVAEDLLMVFRAILRGGAISLDEPMVLYRRGGISRRRRALSAQEVVARLLKNNRHALVELPQLLADARRAGQLAAVEGALSVRLAREMFVRDIFAADGVWRRWRTVTSARRVPLGVRLRIATYAACPGVLGPFFAVMRWAAGRSAR